MKVKVFKLPDKIFQAEYINPRKFYSNDDFFCIKHQDPEKLDDSYSSDYFTFEVTDMTNKTKMTNLETYVELSIQIATLDMKLDAILKLLNKPEIDYEIKTPAMTAASVQEFLNSDNENFEDVYK